jgi:hypothetical protein
MEGRTGDRSMTTALVAVPAAALLAGLAVLWALRTRARFRRALEAAGETLEEHGRLVEATLERASERAERARTRGASELELAFDLGTLLTRAAREAAERARAPAAAVRVERPGAEDAVASFGPYRAEMLLARIPVPPQAQPFRALRVSWTHGHGPGDYRSALVVPIVEGETGSGLLVACSGDIDAFGPRQVDELERLSRELSASLANARRFAQIERQGVTEDEAVRMSVREL